MTGEDYEARKDEHRPDWPGYMREAQQRIQRYCPTEWGQMDADAEGGWVTYADHVTFMEGLTAQLRQDHVRSLWNTAYTAGVQAARDAVAALHVYGPEGELEWPENLGGGVIERADALAAIDALRGDA